ncbi:hypothetical protein K353_01024 [Kitasatospora sp. SolWspMP-SS2h]|uniref:hypothetical protein n=1 Tax=Kitasatospora sp. SolWspMP-SS2h TaxID=1305729 RepID=UPI000DC00457|nr:hypothetical protein [Kitasatospora sp. SolWspMP-SS2h]RAJ45526.1 hypothetical protein K353_01024 [Kitasatospora sp. SolWspMP-SS2h]
MTTEDYRTAPSGDAAVRAEDRCQYKSLPLRDFPPLGVVRRLRIAHEQRRQVRVGVPAPGRPSRYREGDWVRIKEAAEIRTTLDAEDRHRGLWFTGSQWSFCGGVHQVERVVRRMVDDHYRIRRLSGTITLTGATCQGADGSQGCGLDCALLFRDEWVEPAAAPPATAAPALHWATVRSLADIRATLDGRGRLHDVPFQPGMERYAGGRFAAAEVSHRSLAWWQRPVGGRWFTLAGLRCDGEPLAATGCDRQCALLWHESWLRLSDAPEQ